MNRRSTTRTKIDFDYIQEGDILKFVPPGKKHNILLFVDDFGRREVTYGVYKKFVRGNRFRCNKDGVLEIWGKNRTYLLDDDTALLLEEPVIDNTKLNPSDIFNPYEKIR